ncbi:MAG: ABC transporter permease [Lachnospiraceae bacterium]|nr:ABC transporter permease [Lachnospiraceae bacterium]MDD3616395.1 ABC transporter permease [Lachnospiraceae bacterium]
MKILNMVKAYFKRYGGILAALLILCIALSFVSPAFATQNNWINILRQISINALIAFGITQLIIVGGIDLSVGGVVAMSGCTSVVLINSGMPVAIAVILALLTGLLAGLINGFCVTVVKIVPFVVTLASFNIYSGLAYVVSNGSSVACKNIAFSKLGTGYIGAVPVPVIVMGVIMLLCWLIMNKTVLGQHIYATGGNERAAEYAGINTKKTRMFCYSLCGVLAAIAGVVLAAKMYSGQPTVGVGYEGDAIAASVLGGVSFEGGAGTIGGTLIGAIVIGVISNGLNLVGASYQTQLIAKGIIILIAVGIDTLKKEHVFNNLFGKVKNV